MCWLILGWTTGNGFMINHLTSVKTVTEELSQATEQFAVEQSRLAQMQEKAQSIQDVLAGLEERRVALIRQQAAEQNKAYQSHAGYERSAYGIQPPAGAG